VIIPNYNHAAFLKQRIDSVLAQSFTDFELIILDDCSTDNSREIIEQYRGHPQITTIVYNEANSGSPFKQWEKGIEMARGKYIWFAESDDYASPDLLKKLVPLFDEVPNIGLVFCNSHVVDAHGDITGTTNNWAQAYALVQGQEKTTVFNGEQFCRDHLFLVNRIPNASAVLFNREMVMQHAYWIDASLRNSGDWKLWINIALHANLVWLNEDLNYLRRHGNNVTNSLPLLKMEALGIIKELIHDKNVKKHYRLYESCCFWSFNSAAWTMDPRYNRTNFGYYFTQNCSFLSMLYLVYFLMKQFAIRGIGYLRKKPGELEPVH
jgi:glycosyltransferase involved in cell wall biosynthesis